MTVTQKYTLNFWFTTLYSFPLKHHKTHLLDMDHARVARTFEVSAKKLAGMPVRTILIWSLRDPQATGRLDSSTFLQDRQNQQDRWFTTDASPHRLNDGGVYKWNS
jgi:hypothetical protein